jgi:hypothetical protein
MHRWKHGQLHSGSKSGPLVKNRAQAIAIMMSERRAEQRHGGKYPEKKQDGGGIDFDRAATDESYRTQILSNPKLSAQIDKHFGIGSYASPPMSPGFDPQAVPSRPIFHEPGGSIDASGRVHGMQGGGKAFGGPNLDRFNMENMVMRGSMYGLRHEGMIHSSVPGRTDRLPMSVRSGSYVLPADIPSALGQGNSMAGGKILQKMFSSGPYGMAPMSGGRGSGQPKMSWMRPPSMPSTGMGRTKTGGFAEGGTTPKPPRAPLRDRLDPAVIGPRPLMPSMVPSQRRALPIQQYDPDNPDLGGMDYARGGMHRTAPGHVPIIAAGGEFLIHPDVVRDIGHGDIKAGHAVLDAFVLRVRKKYAETLKKLPGPKR